MSSESTKEVRVRFPPSPTGFCHVGTARMAILNYLFARRHGGRITFRSEDTDQERSSRQFETDITESLTWLGLSWDEFYRQSERTDIYRASIEQLIKEEKAYISEEESKKEPGVQVHPVRLKNPGRSITFTDIIRGEITFDTTELHDFVIARSIDDPLYHLAVVVDDADMGITHVIRGEDHISNTPRQILIQEALGLERPSYAHYPLHLGSDRSKLSKRTGDVSLKSYREKGYLSEALLNYIALLGWTPPSRREVMSLNEMVGEFHLGDLHRSGAVFDVDKLRWYNRHYLLQQNEDALLHSIVSTLKPCIEERPLPWDETIGRQLVPLIRERISVISDIDEMVQTGELDFFFRDPAPEAVRIPEKKSEPHTALVHLRYIYATLEGHPDAQWSGDALKTALWEYATLHGRGNVLWPFRYALSGIEKSADPFFIASTIGKSITMHRVGTAIKALENL